MDGQEFSIINVISLL